MAKARESSRQSALPELAAFFICEKILQEGDRVLSVIRIVDTLTVPPRPTPESQAPVKGTVVAFPPLVLCVMLKSGNARGVRRVRLRLVNPSLERENLAKTWQVVFKKPPEGGHNLMFPLVIKWDKPGLYWFELLVDNKRLGRTPLKVKVQQPPASNGSGTG